MSNITNLFKENTADYKDQEQLAETYLSSSTNDLERPKGHKGSRAFFVALALTVSILLTLLVSIFYLVSNYNVSFNIKLDKKPQYQYENLLGNHNIAFLGNGVRRMGYVTLISKGVRDRASVVLDLKEGGNLAEKAILMTMMAKGGKGVLKVIFRDGNYRSYILSKVAIDGLDQEWRNIVIPVERSKESVDLADIRHIRLELEGGEVYIKKIVLIDH